MSEASATETVEDSVPVPRGRTYLWPHGGMFIGTDLVTEPHSHFPAALAFSLEGTLRARVGPDCERGAWTEHRSILVPPNVLQEKDGRDRTLVILQIEPETRSFRRMAHWFEGQKPRELPEPVTERLVQLASEFLEREGDPELLWQRMIDTLARPGGAFRELDPRVVDALSSIKAGLPDAPSSAELARTLSLSEGRFMHLFREQMGLPVRRYVLWLRLRDAFYALAAGSNITDAAMTAGFADSAHLSRTFRSMFGLAPSTVLRASCTVRVDFRLPVLDELVAAHQRIELERWAHVIQRMMGDATPPLAAPR